jgi:hypothetical protein
MPKELAALVDEGFKATPAPPRNSSTRSPKTIIE